MRKQDDYDERNTDIDSDDDSFDDSEVELWGNAKG